MEDANQTSPVTPERIRQLLLRNGLESNRFREAVAWALRITPTEANALAIMSLGAAVCPSQLGQRLGLSSGGTTALIQRLETRAYIERAPNPSDARSTLLSLGPTAVAELGSLYAPLVAQIDQLIGARSEQERAAIARLLSDACEEVVRATEGLRHAECAALEGHRSGPEPDLWA
jgi:DNA-binding MarR family transcriptional regulator